MRSGRPRLARRSRTCSTARRWSSPASSRPRARRCSNGPATGRTDGVRGRRSARCVRLFLGHADLLVDEFKRKGAAKRAGSATRGVLHDVPSNELKSNPRHEGPAGESNLPTSDVIISDVPKNARPSSPIDYKSESVNYLRCVGSVSERVAAD